MRFRSDLASVLGSIILLLAGTPALPETLGNPDFCHQEPVNKQNSEKVIAGCTTIIDAGTVSRNDLGQAHFMRGRGYYKGGDKLAAADDFRTVLKLTPENAKNHRESINWLAAIASEIANGCNQPPYDELKPETVVPACSRAIEAKHLFRESEVAALYFRRGRAYSKQGEPAPALRDYDDALSLDPEWTDAHNNRGSILKNQNQHEQAIAAFDRAIAIDPDYWRAHYNRGSIYEADQDHGLAIADYRSVIRLLKPSDFTKSLEEKISKLEQKVAQAGSPTGNAAEPAQNSGRSAQIEQLKREKARYESLLKANMISRTEAEAAIAKIDRLIGGGQPQVAAKPATEQPKPLASSKPAAIAPDENRVALVIGNSAYTNTVALPNPKNDARLIARSLEAVGFDVTLVIDADQKAMKRAMLTFGRALRENATTGLFYYAGHGVQVRGRNYLIPVNASISAEDEIDLEGIEVNRFLQVMNDSKSRVNIVVLDACRNNPFARSFRSSGGGGLAPVSAPRGTYIAYATGPGQVAVDGDGENSPYTEALSRAITEPGLSLETVFKRTRASVLKVTDEQQVPWETSSITGEFYFRPAN